MSETRVMLGFIGAGLLFVAILIISMFLDQDAQSQKMRLLVLDGPACEAVRRLGLDASAIENGACTLNARTDFRSEWLMLGDAMLNTRYVVVVRDVE